MSHRDIDCNNPGSWPRWATRRIADKPTKAMPWEARRWCNSDDDWSNWQPCTDEQKAEWSKLGDFQFRAKKEQP